MKEEEVLGILTGAAPAKKETRRIEEVSSLSRQPSAVSHDI